MLGRGLREEGFVAAAAATGREALARVEQRDPTRSIIDIGLPDTDGRDLCQALRARGIQTPVLFLTARDALVDRIAGFDAGGDDYVAKPFAFAELVAGCTRARAPRRKRGRGRGGRPSARSAHALRRRRRRRGALTPTEFRLLARLLARPGEAVRRRDLVRAGWPHGAIVRENTLDAYIARLRRKLRELDGAPEIGTVHGVGYRIQ